MKLVPLTKNDILIDTSKTTTGYFSGGKGNLAGANFTTASLSATQKQYYYTLQYNSEDHFGCSFGHSAGTGSSTSALNAGIGETQAIYESFASKLLRAADVEGGFKISGSATVKEDAVWILVAERAKMKDRLNAGNWTLSLSGSAGATNHEVKLTDDSKTNYAYASPLGPRYNIVSGTKGTVHTAASTKRFGYFWPEVGTMVFSSAVLSASLPGAGTPKAYRSGSVNFKEDDTNFAINTEADSNNALKLASSIALGGGGTHPHTFRAEEDQTTVSYFCRALSRDFNHSGNPTFISGSEGRYRQPGYVGNPQTFITTVGLYNGANEMVAVGRLSKPIQKNYSKEAIIKVKLTY